MTEMISQEIASSAVVSKSDPVLAAQQLERRQGEAKKSMEQQEARKKLFERQGSLRSIM
jgi:hypothetical protein